MLLGITSLRNSLSIVTVIALALLTLSAYDLRR